MKQNLYCDCFILRSLVVTSEALFSLINGDDMYMTYEEMSNDSQVSWVFSQVSTTAV